MNRVVGMLRCFICCFLIFQSQVYANNDEAKDICSAHSSTDAENYWCDIIFSPKSYLVKLVIYYFFFEYLGMQ